MPAAQALLQILGCLPSLAPGYSHRLDWLRGLLGNTKEDLRETVAATLGLVAAPLPEKDFEKAMRDLGKAVREKGLEHQHGALLALGHGHGRRVLLTRMSGPDQVRGAEWRAYSDHCQFAIRLHFTLKQLAEMHVTKLGVDTKGGDHGDEAKRKARCHSKGSSKKYFSTTTYHGCAVSAAGAWLEEDDPGAGAQCRAPLREREFRFRPSCHGDGAG
jgi:hypothetical protein